MEKGKIAIFAVALIAFGLILSGFEVRVSSGADSEVKNALPQIDANPNQGISFSDSNSAAYAANRKESESLKFIGIKCSSVRRAATPDKEEFLGCSHNLETSAGKTIVTGALAGISGQQQNISWMLFGNLTAPATGDTQLSNEITTCGFTRAQGTLIMRNATAFTFQRTVTSTCNNLVVNTTALSNSSVASSAYAFGGTISNYPTLQTGDTLTQNYTIVDNS